MCPHTWVRAADGSGPVKDPAITAANRIIHGFDEDMTPGQCLDQLMADAQLVAGAFIEAVTE